MCPIYDSSVFEMLKSSLLFLSECSPIVSLLFGLTWFSLGRSLLALRQNCVGGVDSQGERGQEVHIALRHLHAESKFLVGIRGRRAEACAD